MNNFVVQPEPVPPPGAIPSPHDVDPGEMIQVTVVVKPPLQKQRAKKRAVANLIRARMKPVSSKPSGNKKAKSRLSAQEFESLYGVEQQTIDRVKAWAAQHHLQTVDASTERRCVVLKGKMADFEAAFNIQMVQYVWNGADYFTHKGAIQVPDNLADAVSAVFGLDNRIIGQRHNFGSGVNPIDPRKVSKQYKFPKGPSGTGERIAIIELGGGIRMSDLITYFEFFNVQMPTVTIKELFGTPDLYGGNGTNQPASDSDIQTFWNAVTTLPHDYCPPVTPILGSIAEDSRVLWTIESTMDAELAGLLAPGAEIVVYFTPNNAQGKYHAMSTILTDPNLPSVISCSFGMPEEFVQPVYVNEMEAFFEDAMLKGITVCFSSGDTGDGSHCDGVSRVNYPGSSPSVLSCGGTMFSIKTPSKERVWNESIFGIPFASGGGFSNLFTRPVWQSKAIGGSRIPLPRGKRGVPDVASRANLKNGYRVHVGGIDVAMGGTSSSAPVWASLIAVINSTILQPVGFINPVLYNAGPGKFFDVKKGSNGPVFKAKTGWDACTGLGRPDGIALLKLFQLFL